MKSITVQDLAKKLMSDNTIQVVDVRTPAEHRAVHIDGVTSIPSEQIVGRKDELGADGDVYVCCHSGNRSRMVCEDLALHGVTNLVNVEGGIQAWIRAGLPVVRTKKWSMPIMQQVMVVAGTLIMSGVIASKEIHPDFMWLSFAVGLGLFYAGVSGNCYMTKLLDKMPWNR